jgi:hypothetical protein
MSIPLPPVSGPRALWQDLRGFIAHRSPYQWVAAGLAVLMPVVILILFVLDGKSTGVQRPQVIYVDSWSAARSDDEIKASQKAAQERRQAEALERQRQFQELGNRFGM